MSDGPMGEYHFAVGAQDGILHRRAESLAVEQVEDVDEQRSGVLLFALGDEWYGVRATQVREVYKEYVVTPIPCVPEHIRGVVNIRGEIVSVTDLRVMMALGSTGVSTAHVQPPLIIVADDTVSTALMVDSVGDIAEVGNEAIEPTLALMERAQPSCVCGTFFVAGTLVALVDLSRVLTPIVGR